MNVYKHKHNIYICMLYLLSLPTLPSSVTDYGRDQHGMQQYQRTITNILKKRTKYATITADNKYIEKKDNKCLYCGQAQKIEFQVNRN